MLLTMTAINSPVPMPPWMEIRDIWNGVAVSAIPHCALDRGGGV
jgi:hypothetical protein